MITPCLPAQDKAKELLFAGTRTETNLDLVNWKVHNTTWVDYGEHATTSRGRMMTQDYMDTISKTLDHILWYTNQLAKAIQTDG